MAATRTVSLAVDVQLSVFGWTDISADVDAAYGLTLRYGIDGSGPLDRIASTGELQFTLRNDAGNSGGVQGWYSPQHASRRTGWAFDIPVRVRFTSGTLIDVVKFIGTIRVIDPDPGVARAQRVHVTAYDKVRDLSEADAREVTLQVDQTETDLLNALLDTLSADHQPTAIDLNTGVDSYPIAFDDVGDAKVLAVAADVVLSSFGLFFIRGDGTLCYRSRHTLAIATSAFTFTNDMHGLVVPSTTDGVVLRARATTHPKAVSATATDALYVSPVGTTFEVPALETREAWTDYSDPLDRETPVGGTAVVTVLVAGTHYTANSAADGSGDNLAASITPSIDPFSSTAKWTLINTGVVLAFVSLTVIGKAVRDPGPQHFESGTAGEKPVFIDLPYQDDPYIGQSVADFVVSQYGDPEQVESLSFITHHSADFMEQALLREPGDRITVVETVTGIDLDATILHVDFHVTQGPYLVCQFGLTPASTGLFWQLGVAGSSELGETTVVGF